MSRNVRLEIASLVLLSLVHIQGNAAEPPARPAPSPPPNGVTVPVHISGIRMLGPEQVLLLLADESEERAVPISVGRDQGIAIYLGKLKADTPRPMTHDLLANVIAALGATMEKMTVTRLQNNIYFAEIGLRGPGSKVHAIDARPSDAIALAVRTGAPMFSASDLLHRVDAREGPDATVHADRRLGLTVQQLDQELAESLGAGGVTGVLVASVAHGGTAERAGVKRGDIVRSIDGRPVTNVGSYREVSGPAAKSLTIWREGREATLRAF